jgi:hypothetical protein
MSKLDSIVNVRVSSQTKQVKIKSFGIAAFVAYQTIMPGRINEIEDTDDLITAGFGTDHAVYRGIAKIFGQKNAPNKVKLITIDTAPAHTVEISLKTGAATTGTIIKFKTKVRDGVGLEVAVSYTVPGASTLTSVHAAVAALITNSGVTPTASASKISCVTAGGKLLDVYDIEMSIGRDKIDIKDVTAAPGTGYATALGLAKALDSDWYAVSSDVNSDAVVKEIAAYIETQANVYFYNLSSLDVGDNTSTTDTQAALATLSYDRSAGLDKLDSVLNCGGAGWMGAVLATTPGSATWAFKSIAGVPVDNQNGKESVIEGKHGNYYSEIGGANVTLPGQVCSGEFIDIIIFSDWIKARLQERVFALFVNNPKVAFTDAGGDKIRAVIHSVLEEGISANGLVRDLTLDPAFGYSILIPKAADLDDSFKVARKWPNIVVQTRLAGAVHAVDPLTITLVP